MAGCQNHLEAPSRTCLVLGLKGLESWAQLGRLISPPICSLFMWIVLPHSIATSSQTFPKQLVAPRVSIPAKKAEVA